jgi:hypothetical protein
MAAYTVVNVDRNGARYDNALTAVAASDTFANDGRTFLYVDNQNASTCNVTIDLASDPLSSVDTHSSTATNLPLLTTEGHLFGPFPTGRYGDTVTVNYDITASVTAMAFRLTSG